MQVDAVHVSGGQERQGRRPNKGKGGKGGEGGKGKAKKGGKGKEKMRNQLTSSEANADTARRRDTRRRIAAR